MPFPYMSPEKRQELMDKYQMENHLISVGKTRTGEQQYYLPARIRLFWLHLQIPEVNIETRVIWRSEDGKQIEVECRMWIGVDYESATIKGNDFKRGLEADLDKVVTKAEARCALTRFAIGAEYALDFDDEDIKRLKEENGEESQVASAPMTVVTMPRPQVQVAPTPAAKPKSVVSSTTTTQQKPTAGTATIKREPAPEPKASYALSPTIETALAPDQRGRKDLTPVQQEIVDHVNDLFGPFEARAMLLWQNNTKGLPIDAMNWDEGHANLLLNNEYGDWYAFDDPVFGHKAWQTQKSFAAQKDDIKDWNKKVGGPTFKEFRNSFTAIDEKMTADMTALQADTLIWGLEHAYKYKEGRKELILTTGERQTMNERLEIPI